MVLVSALVVDEGMHFSSILSFVVLVTPLLLVSALAMEWLSSACDSVPCPTFLAKAAQDHDSAWF
jgi:hypothetical protein